MLALWMLDWPTRHPENSENCSSTRYPWSGWKSNKDLKVIYVILNQRKKRHDIRQKGLEWYVFWADFFLWNWGVNPPPLTKKNPKNGLWCFTGWQNSAECAWNMREWVGRWWIERPTALEKSLQVMKMPRDKDDGMRMIMMKKKATKRGWHCQLRWLWPD